MSTGTKVLDLPNYALFELARTAQDLERFLEDNFDHFALELLDGPHLIQRLEFNEALRQHTKVCIHILRNFVLIICKLQSDILGETLRIAIVTRFYCRSFGLAGSELLGIVQDTDLESPWFGRVPVPPMLDAQLDELWRGMMMRRQKRLLSMLKGNIINRRRESWLKTFLTTFVILSILEVSYQQKKIQLLRHMVAVNA